MARMEKIGSFGLTEPLVGSGASRGLETTAKREADSWILNGEKKWIGNATFGDLTIIWARDVSDNQVKGFIVENKTPGFKAEKIQNKMALRVVQNAHIILTNCRVPEKNRLQLDTSFRDTARVLRMTRAFVAWEAVGCAMGAYEHALAYAQQRLQFGKPIASFQLVQDSLVKMLGNITASLCMVIRLSQLQDEGKLKDEHASLAKAFCTVKMRETMGYAREILGSNGILLDYQVGRFLREHQGDEHSHRRQSHQRFQRLCVESACNREHFKRKETNPKGSNQLNVIYYFQREKRGTRLQVYFGAPVRSGSRRRPGAVAKPRWLRFENHRH